MLVGRLQSHVIPRSSEESALGSRQTRSRGGPRDKNFLDFAVLLPRRFAGVLLSVAACFAILSQISAAQPSTTFQDNFAANDQSLWDASEQKGGWIVADGMLRRTGSGDTIYRARLTPTANLTVNTRLRLLGGSRQTFGVALRVDGNTYLLVRYYDRPQALEVLSFQNGAFSQVGKRSAKLSVNRDTWYRLKVVAVADRLLAKLWPDDADEPDWQLDVAVSNRNPGTFALVAHDDTLLEFDEVEATTDDEFMSQMLADAKEKERKRIVELRATLKLAIVPATFSTTGPQGSVRRIHVVPYVENDRFPVAGELKVSWGPNQITRKVALEDYKQNGLVIELPVVELPDPKVPVDVRVTLETEFDKLLESDVRLMPTKQLSWRDYVRTSLDTLIKHGRDDYGEIHSPLFMAVLDADLLRSPEKPMRLDALVRLEDRIHRRGERGTNPWYDQALFKSLYRMSELTGDAQYREAADEAISYFFEHCYKEVDPRHVYLNGMPAWGTHVYWDCYRDCPAGDGDGNGPHEILVYRAEWDAMFKQSPEAVRSLIDGIWRFHVVDKGTGLHNRHDDSRQGCDFAFSGGSFAHAMAFMYHATGQQRYLQQARTVVDWHWDNRNLETGLTADTPGIEGRYDGHHCFTTVAGPHVLSLLECYRLTGDPHFRDVAIGYVKAYDRYGWDEENQTYAAMIKLDGTPVPKRAKGSGYDAFAPSGPVDVWRSTIYSYEFTLAAAQAAIAAYEVTVQDGHPDVGLLQLARRWGSVVERALPPKTSRRWKTELENAMPEVREFGGVYAEDYGRAISLFVHLHRATGEQRHLEIAKGLASEAVKKLFRNGIFVGHPAKPYYENTNGVGLLLVALLELDAPDEDLGGAL